MPVNAPNTFYKVQSNRNVQLLILLIFAVILVNGLFFLFLIRQNQRSLAEREHNEKAMMLTRRILGSVKDAEIEHRGYILTGKEKYILPYEEHYKTVSTNEQLLSQLVMSQSNAEDKKELAYLKKALAAKRAEMDKMIRMSPQERITVRQKTIKTDFAEDEMNNIRNSCNRLLDSFYRNLVVEDQQASITLHHAGVSIGVLSAIVISGMAVMLTKLVNNQKKINMLFNAKELKNSKLLSQQQELKRLSVDFSARNSELEHFTHVISHDLRGPLNNAIALVGIIEDDCPPVTLAPSFQMLKTVTLGLLLKMDELIVLLRHRNGANLLKEDISLSQLTEEVIKNHQIEMEKAGTEIEGDFSEADEVNSVKIYMQSILQNLISNAIKYREPLRKNKILIKTFKEGNILLLKVTDNGRGIDLKKHGEDVFGLFKTFHTGQDSHGVGLYLVKKQIKEMGGNIKVESEVGQGTTFCITIPLGEAVI